MNNPSEKSERPLDHEDKSNPDPITGQPGSHPVATGIGATGGALAATVAGAAVGGPLGGAIGAMIGGVAGGLAGKAVGEGVNPTEEEAYWRTSHPDQPHGNEPYDIYAPAYRSGYEGYNEHRQSHRSFDEAEADIRTNYEKEGNTVPWDKARGASRSAWERAAGRHAGAAAIQSSQGPSTTGNI